MKTPQKWRFGIGFCLLIAFLPIAGWPVSAGKAEHVVIIVWDGMRPDFIRPQYTPTLCQLAQQGVFFKHHHPVFVSSTEVNGAALITGAYPEHSGLWGNRDYRPEISWLDADATEALETVRRGDFLSGGHFLAAPTLTEILHGAGFRTVVAGTKPVALLLDRGWGRISASAQESITLYSGHTVPPAALDALVKANDDKAFPSVTYPNVAEDAWTTKALIHGLWKKEVPKLSVLWLSDPDYSQHDSGPGSDTAVGGLQSADRNLAAVCKALEENKVRDQTDIFIVSDHGFSTIERAVDVADLLKRANFKATRKFEDPEPGEILVIGLGGSVALYVVGHDPVVIRDLVEFFQASDFAGVIFSALPVEGTFPLAQVRIASTNAPDLLVSMRWCTARNDFGAPGGVISDGGKRGKGTHASLSRFDLHNTLVAVGPDFRAGFLDELPSGSADLGPTILWLLGLFPPLPMDGRVLTEALVGGHEPPPKAEQKTVEASHAGSLFHWRQYLKFSTVGKAIYFDEGNGESVLR
jgi:arylsulfatase A-like enzyme